MIDAVKPAIDDPRFSRLLMGSRTDRLLLLISLTGILLAWLTVQTLVASGPAVVDIYHGKLLLATYPLPSTGDKPIRLDVEGEIGRSEIEIDENGARMVASACSSKRCVYAGAHRHAGDMIACVPNRILITIRGRAESRFDAIVE